MLRSSAAADGGRCFRFEFHLVDHLAVAILGRRGRRPLQARPRGGTRYILLRSSAAADGGRCRWVLDGLRALPTLRSSAAADGGRCSSPMRRFSSQTLLRSSAAADGGRCPEDPLNRADGQVLRSSAAADGGRCQRVSPLVLDEADVAILGRRGRRPLPTSTADG